MRGSGADAADADILATDVPLKEVQFALAMHYGFKTWDELRAAAGGAGELTVRPYRTKDIPGMLAVAEALGDEFRITICSQGRSRLRVT